MTSDKLLTEGSIAKKLILFAIPMFLGNLFQQLYNVADSLVVGNYLGGGALAAVTSTGSLIFLLVGFFNGTAMGAGVIIARYFGAKDYVNVRRAVHTTVAVGIICGILMTAVGVVFAPQILSLMGTPQDVFVQSVGYIRVYFLGSIAVVMYNVCMGILQAVGDSRHPLYYLIISSVVNIILDLIFNGALRLGVEYAALATIISQLFAVVLCMIRLTRTEEVYRVDLRKIRFHKDMVGQILKLGLPSGLQNSIISIANVVVQANINSFGSDAMAGCGTYFKIEGFAFLPITCFAMALTTFIGQNLGARKYDRVKRGAAFGIACSVICAELVGILVYVFMPRLVVLFNSEPNVIQYGVSQARTEALFYCLLAFSHCVAGIMRGAGKSIVPMLVMLACWCIIRISYITIATHIWDNIQVIFRAYPITWSLSTVVFLIYLLKADWMHAFDKMEVK